MLPSMLWVVAVFLVGPGDTVSCFVSGHVDCTPHSQQVFWLGKDPDTFTGYIYVVSTVVKSVGN